MPNEIRFAMRVVTKVLPFRVNQYVIRHLINWENVPDDPIFRLTFPQQDMLSPEHFDRMANLLRSGADDKEIRTLANEIRAELNPHPAGQQILNIPVLDGRPLKGMQHKYRETVLFFPRQGQTCHTYCTFCFRWPQFVGIEELRFSASETRDLHRYLANNKDVTDFLLTGGDPMVMKTNLLKEYIKPLLQPQFEHIHTIRIGTKSLTYWPYRYVSDGDADDLLRLMERMIRGGKHVAIMAHYNHWQEMETPIARKAIRRICDTGAIIRSQSPVVAYINDDPEVWARMWRTQVRLGIVPYYMFIVRNTGACNYFEVPLAKAYEIYHNALLKVSGLGRTVRGPSMSAGPGKIEIQGIAEINNEKVFVLRFIQGRNPDWIQRPFFARFDPEATWLNHLRPAFGAEKFFYEDEYQAICERERSLEVPSVETA
ncbi:MAG: lysine 2,3-aminomutase [Deltaproteobacteria bacterium]|nr:lysine 2,3-aminomutase [Deltaproteobacteria bacterium]MDL1960653.1 lysine 2,3-aminomutase [Deltaproteobacteria bacterium]